MEGLVTRLQCSKAFQINSLVQSMAGCFGMIGLPSDRICHYLSVFPDWPNPCWLQLVTFGIANAGTKSPCSRREQIWRAVTPALAARGDGTAGERRQGWAGGKLCHHPLKSPLLEKLSCASAHSTRRVSSLHLEGCTSELPDSITRINRTKPGEPPPDQSYIATARHRACML